MIKNNKELREINEDYEQIRLFSSYLNTNIKKKKNKVKSIYKIIKSKYLLYLITIIIFLFTFFIILLILIPKKSSNETPFQIKSQISSQTSPQSSPQTSPQTSSLFSYNNLMIIKNKLAGYDYDKTGTEIYSSTGKLSFNKLDEIFNGTKISSSKYNHIHIAMSFNNDYHLLSAVTIASLLKNAHESTYIHLHIIAVDGFIYSIMKKLNSLKTKINNNTEFIFHNGDIILKDFGSETKTEATGVGEYARLLAPYFASDADRIIITDSGDLLIKKDLLELYNYPLDDKLVKGIIDPYTNCFPEYFYFRKENYMNGGVLLFNAKKWREMDLYQDIVNFYNGFNYKGRLPTPIQDILNTIFPAVSLGLLPLRYNFQGYVLLKEEEQFYSMIYDSECSLYFNRKEELINEEENVFIRHCNKFKVYEGEAPPIIKNEWQYYAKLTGFYDEICENYPISCE